MRSFSAICDAHVKKWMRPLTGDFKSTYAQLHLSAQAQQLLHLAFSNLPFEKLVDYHVHVMGTKTACTGNFIHSNFLSWKHPVMHLLCLAYENILGIEDRREADQQVLDHLVHLIRCMPAHGKYCLLAFDSHYDENGFFDLVKSKIHVSNEYIFQVASQYPDCFLPSISVHPYRADALGELEKWAERGVKLIKWMPNAMGMNPMDRRCMKYYDKVRDLNLILLVHIGHESAVPVTGDQELGNPLLLRRALDQGVKVIMAHCGTLGKGKDWDHFGKKVPNFELFLRLMDDPNYKGNLYGDLASVTQVNRCKYLSSIIEFSQPGELLSHRLVNGSDYPLPAMNLLVSTRVLKMKGFLTEEERTGLNEIYRWNPLLFDLVLKRTIRHPQTHKKLPIDVFLVNENLNILT
jgi:predicted TIM-barrel fold metal-dependent hydrolase